MVGNIQNPDYETVSAECEHCGALCVFNRIDDIGDPAGPYDGREVICYECGEPFWIHGDIINPAYYLLISSAEERFGTKRYMQCVALLAQAWEIFFSTFLYSNYLYRPYFASLELDPGSEHLLRLSSQLYRATRKFTFYPLRNTLANTVIRQVHPRTLKESEAAIPRIEEENFGGDPKPSAIEKVPKVEIRNLLEQLQELKIGELRNEVVHQHARRPRREEVEGCLYGEIGLLYRVRDTLPVYTFEYWRFKSNQERRT